jgi:hypothetical protein
MYGAPLPQCFRIKFTEAIHQPQTLVENKQPERSWKSVSRHGMQMGIRMWIMLRDRIEYNEFCRRGHAAEEW